MATRLQKKLAKAIIEDSKNTKPMTAKDLLVSVGYSEKTAEKRQHEVIRSFGVKEELKANGFSLDEADDTVGFILRKGKTDKSKLDAADKIYKRLGGYAPDKHIVGTISITELLKAAKEEDK